MEPQSNTLGERPSARAKARLAGAPRATNHRQGTIEGRRRAVEHAVAAMLRAFPAPQSLHALSTYVNCSPYHLDRIFRDETGISPTRFLSAVRLDQAKRLLVT